MNPFNQAVDELVYSVEREMKYLTATTKALTIFSAFPELMQKIAEDVEKVSVYWDTLTLRLHEDKKNSRLAHKVSQAFGIEMEKRPSFDGTSLKIVGNLLEDLKEEYGFSTIEITGYKPETCKVVTEYVPYDEKEKARQLELIEKRRSEVERGWVKTKVVCDG